MTEAIGGFATDVGRQVMVDGKSLDEVDYGQAVKTGAVSGVTGMGGYAVGYAAGAAKSAMKSTAKNAGSTMSKAVTKRVDDAVDAVDDSIAKSVSKSSAGDAVSVRKSSAATTRTTAVTNQTSVPTKNTVVTNRTSTQVKPSSNAVTPSRATTAVKNAADVSPRQTKVQSTVSGNRSGKTTIKNVFPENPDDLFPEISRNKVIKPNGTVSQTIYPSDNIRIRAEQHPLLPGETYNPRHHGVHYHVEYRVDSLKSWNNKSNINKLYPEGYIPGSGTGFMPGELFLK